MPVMRHVTGAHAAVRVGFHARAHHTRSISTTSTIFEVKEQKLQVTRQYWSEQRRNRLVDR